MKTVLNEVEFYTVSVRTFGIPLKFGSGSAMAKRSRSDPNPDPPHCFSLYSVHIYFD
jgi:hypothetical protein